MWTLILWNYVKSMKRLPKSLIDILVKGKKCCFEGLKISIKEYGPFEQLRLLLCTCFPRGGMRLFTIHWEILFPSRRREISNFQSPTAISPPNVFQICSIGFLSRQYAGHSVHCNVAVMLSQWLAVWGWNNYAWKKIAVVQHTTWGLSISSVYLCVIPILFRMVCTSAYSFTLITPYSTCSRRNYLS